LKYKPDFVTVYYSIKKEGSQWFLADDNR